MNTNLTVRQAIAAVAAEPWDPALDRVVNVEREDAYVVIALGAGGRIHYAARMQPPPFPLAPLACVERKR